MTNASVYNNYIIIHTFATSVGPSPFCQTKAIAIKDRTRWAKRSWFFSSWSTFKDNKSILSWKKNAFFAFTCNL